MEQKEIYMRYLLTGISIIILSFSGCEKEVEYRLDTEFVFNNQTDNTIMFSVNDPSGDRDQISLAPFEADTIIYKASGGFEDPDPDLCCQGLLEDILGSGQGLTVTIDESTCSISQPLDIDNYDVEVVNERFYRYRFVFNDAVLADTVNCQ